MKAINILSFCEIIGLDLQIQYISRANRNDDLWACSLEDTGIQTSGGAWTSHHAFGNSPEEAIHNFVNKSKGLTLVKSWGDSEAEKKIHVPKDLYYENY